MSLGGYLTSSQEPSFPRSSQHTYLILPRLVKQWVFSSIEAWGQIWYLFIHPQTVARLDRLSDTLDFMSIPAHLSFRLTTHSGCTHAGGLGRNLQAQLLPMLASVGSLSDHLWPVVEPRVACCTTPPGYLPTRLPATSRYRRRAADRRVLISTCLRRGPGCRQSSEWAFNNHR